MAESVVIASELEYAFEESDLAVDDFGLSPRRWIGARRFGFKVTVWDPDDPGVVRIYDTTKAARDALTGRDGKMTIRASTRAEQLMGKLQLVLREETKGYRAADHAFGPV